MSECVKLVWQTRFLKFLNFAWKIKLHCWQQMPSANLLCLALTKYFPNIPIWITSEVVFHDCSGSLRLYPTHIGALLQTAVVLYSTLPSYTRSTHVQCGIVIEFFSLLHQGLNSFGLLGELWVHDKTPCPGTVDFSRNSSFRHGFVPSVQMSGLTNVSNRVL